MPSGSRHISVAQQSCELAPADHETVSGAVPSRFDGIDPTAGMSAICGGVMASGGETAVTDCPHPPGPMRAGWLRGFLSVCVSQFSQDSADFGLSNVKQGRPGERARWSVIEIEFLDLAVPGLDRGAVAYLLGRPPGAVKVKACRLGLLKR